MPDSPPQPAPASPSDLDAEATPPRGALPLAEAETPVRAEPLDPLLGEVLGERYMVVRRLGEGGMSTLYVARHLLLGRMVAIKVPRPEIASDPPSVERFINEGRAAGSLGHPNIVECTDMGFLPSGPPFLVLELLDGISLASEIREHGPLAPGRAAYLGIQVTWALTAAHSHGIVHRDLKSDNVFITRVHGEHDHIKVLDFGISKFAGTEARAFATEKGVVMGTPDFMAPEQVSSSPVDERTDVYSLGAVLYDMLAGVPPFASVPFPLNLYHITAVDPARLELVRPGLPEGLVAVVHRALAKVPAERYQGMEELGAALREFVDPELLGRWSGLIPLPGPQARKTAPRPAGHDATPPPIGPAPATPFAPTLSARVGATASSVPPAPPSGTGARLASSPAPRAQDLLDSEDENSRGGLTVIDPGAAPPPPRPARKRPLLLALGLVTVVAGAAGVGWLAASRPEAPATPAPTASTAPPALAPPSPESSARWAITSFPAGAAVWLDGQDTGLVTPVALRFDRSGRHRVVLRRAGYIDVAESWLAHPGGERTAHVDLTPVPEDPAGAVRTPDGGTAAAAASPAAPAPGTSSDAGAEPTSPRARPTAARTGAPAPRARKGPGATVAAPATSRRGRDGGADGNAGAGAAAATGSDGGATPAVSTGRLSLETAPWSDVYLAGKRLGRTPLVELPLPPGVHVLELVNEARNIRERYRVTIQPGKVVTKRLAF